MAQSFVPLLVLVTSGGVHAADIASGSTRFVLTRSDRLTWSLGKFLGHALLLVAWALYLGNAAMLLAMPLYVGYITRFQILPEERQLAARFPQRYATYCRAVPRWV